MAQQQPPAPSYGAYYAQGALPSYETPASSANTAGPMLQHNMQRSSMPVPSSTQNAQRYGMNAQAIAPPMPFQLPSNLNPVFLKYFTGSSLPPPLPPPPPMRPNLSSTPLNQANLPVSAQNNTLSPSSIPPPNPYLYNLASAQPFLGNVPAQFGSSNTIAAKDEAHPPFNEAYETEKASVATSAKFRPQTFDGAGLSTPSRDFSEVANSNKEQQALQQQVSSQLQTELRTSSRQDHQHPLHNQDDTKERAKAAIMLLVSSGITYEDFLREGIDASVVGSLFDELSLEKSGTSSAPQMTQAQPKPAAAQTSHTDTRVVEPSSAEARVQPTIDAGMERKDRIARLLAARKGQGSGGGKASQSASPVTTPGSQAAQPAMSAVKQPTVASSEPNTRQVQTVSESRPQTTEIPVSDSHASSQDIQMSYQSLPTPIRTQLEQSGMSSLIPGLFMTSADLRDSYPSMIEDSGDRHVTDTEMDQEANSDSVAAVSINTAEKLLAKSRKRGSEVLDDETLPGSKRHAIEPEDHPEVEMEVSRSDIDESGGSEEGEYHPEAFDRKENEFQHSKSPSNATVPLEPQPVIASQSGKNPILNNTSNGVSSRQLPAAIPRETISDTSTGDLQIETNGASSKVGQKEASSANINADKTSTIVSPKGPKVDAGKLAARMAALKADLVAKNARKKALQEGMPVLDAEIQNTREELVRLQTDLVRTRVSINERTIELEEARKEEKGLLQKIQSLVQQLNDGVSGQKQFSHELNQLTDQIRAEETDSHNPRSKVVSGSMRAPEQEDHHQSDTVLKHSSRDNVAAREVALNTDQEPYIGSGSLINHQQTQSNSNENKSFDTYPAKDGEELSLSTGEQIVDQGSTADEAVSSNVSGTPNNESDDDQMSIDNDTESEDSGETNGSASMSDSASEKYTVEAENEEADAGKSGESDYEPEDSQMAEADDAQNHEGEEYEPSDDVDILDPAELESMRRENDSSAAISHHPGETLTNGTGQATPASERPISPVKVPNTVTSQVSTVALQPIHVDLATFEALGNSANPNSAHYVPYKSPLTPWKSFRFHPQFNDLIKSGYRSLTYSNQIDPKRPLCQTELAGEICTDANCEEQHFGSMALSDDKILVQMSSADDIKDKVKKDAFLLGLKQVIGDLRERGVKEFSEVAEALSKYRREWVEAQQASSV